MKERFLFLTNESTVGIFNTDDNNWIFILLSDNGEFVQTIKGETKSIHLTRYCPIEFFIHIRKLLKFRNRYASSPYLCQRFYNEVSEKFLGSKTQKFNQYRQNIIVKGWNIFTNGYGNNIFAVCPYKKRLCSISQAVYIPNNTLEKNRSELEAESENLLSVKHLTVMPLSFAPLYFHSIDKKNNLNLSSTHEKKKDKIAVGIETAFHFQLPYSRICGASNSFKACQFFDEIESELSTLKYLDR